MSSSSDAREVARVIRTIREIDRACHVARGLNEGSDNPEYVRGQVELICDLFGLGGTDDFRELITEAIVGPPPQPGSIGSVVSEDALAVIESLSHGAPGHVYSPEACAACQRWVAG